MEIRKIDLDALNAIVKITIDRSDYEKNVLAVLIDYKKKR